ncbi:alpha/beta hydrolase family protein [Aestuariimicrobium sp. T2.26MG-19.2B]|uniref:alpha/beta hydrolase family protein n=1 Tax=Aestuariimicrobium sp. T2.26MG-19.2B TaxID=3040679 RepID=UPI0024775801|nr:alpha/beta family hydrolase [Aestuariimicrobium sp. T2.26MG-19.2B]CAI9410542.1 hypothetical protein AESSP_02460 [Aestuariimicrobium sp. T2.26MG-19.2B]
MTEEFVVDTPEGPGLWTISPAASRGGTVVALGHGAGGQITAKDLVVLSRLLPAHGLHVARFTQPWKVAGRRITAGAPALDRAWLAAVEQVVAHVGADRLVSGGRSNGARVACRTQVESGAVAVVCLAFPLHPPGKPAQSRAQELLASRSPTLVLQGSTDPFGSAEEVRAVLPEGSPVRVVEVGGAPHSLQPPARVRSADEHWRWLGDEVLAFLGLLA